MASKAIGFLNFKFGADLSGFERAMNKAQKKLKKFGNQLQKTGKNMTMGLTLPIVALGGAAIKTFADFEQGMLKVKAVSGATAADFKLLTESAKELGSSTMFSASQVATLQFELSKLGLDPTEILASTESILQLAQATDTELGEAAKTTAVALNSFNAEASEAQRFTDIMALASSSAAMDMEKFAAALPVVGATSRLAGDDFEELAAKLQVLADSGMEGGSMGTHLNKIYSKLAKSGLTWDEGMQKLIDSNFDMVLAQEMFGDRAFKSALILAENIDKTKKYTIANKEATGTAKEMADIMDSGVAGAMRKLKSQTEGLLIQLGTALMPVFQKMMGALSSLVEWFSGLSKEQKDNVVKWGLILAAIGPVLIIVGKMSVGIGALIGVFKGLGKFIVAHPYIALAAALVIVVATFTDWISSLWGVSDAQRAVNDINKEAARAISDQKTEVAILTAILEDENTTLTEKETALKKLQKISPKYYGSLSIAQGKVEGLTTANTKYTASILQQAKAVAAQSKLQKLHAQLLELELNPIYIVGEDVTSLYTDVIQEQIDAVMKLVLANKKLENSNEEVTETIKEESIEVKAVESRIAELEQQLKNAQKVTDEITTSTTKYKSSLDPLIKNIKEYADISTKMWQDGGILEGPENMLNWTKKLTEAQKAHNATVVLFKDIMFSAAMSAANSQENFFKSFIKSIKAAIKQLLIQLAVMTVINLLLGGPTMTLGQAFSASKASVLGLKEGGLVTGPTTALIGEGIGTTASNPEVVAPLDKLKGMIGGGGDQHITVTGKLIGNDIFLSNAKTGVNRLRTT